MAIVRPEPALFAQCFAQTILHQRDRIGAVEHKTASILNYGEFINWLDMDKVNGGSEFFRQRNCVLRHSDRWPWKINGTKIVLICSARLIWGCSLPAQQPGSVLWTVHFLR